MDILSYKRRALGYFPLDNWGGSSSNDDGSSTSDSGSGEGSTGGGGYSLGGISPSSSQAGGGGYQEEYQPPDDPVPAPAPPPVPAYYSEPSTAAQYASYAEGLSKVPTTGPSSGQGGQIVTNNPQSLGFQLATFAKTFLGFAAGGLGIPGLIHSAVAGDLSKLEKPSWSHNMDGASDAYWDNNTPQEARTWGGNGAPVTAYSPGSSVAVRPAERAGNHLYSTSRPIASDPYSTAQPGFSLFPGTRPSTLTQSDPYYTQSQPANQNDGLVLAVLAGLAVIAFS